MGKPYFLPLLIFLACGHASAQVAVGGTSENFESVYWLTWDNSTLVNAPSGWNNNNLVKGTYVWYYSDEIRITAHIQPSSGNNGLGVKKYTPGEWDGDGLRWMYSGEPMGGGLNSPNGVPYSGLANVNNGTTNPFNIEITLEFLIEGEWENINYPGMVIADAEEFDGNGEYIEGRTNATGWQLIDKREEGNSGNYELEFDDDYFKLEATRSGTNSQAVLFAKGATALEEVAMYGTGHTSLAIGFVLPFDKSESERYCEASHYIDDFDFDTPEFGSVTRDLDDLEVSELNAIPTLYIGSSENPLDNGSLDEQELEINFTQNEIEISVPVTNDKAANATLYWWVDFNDDGVFSDNEVKAFPDVAPGFSSEEVSLVFTEADFPGEYIGRNLKVGPLHSRLRITTTALEDNPETLQDERSCALAADGEVEDYIFTVKGINISGTVRIDPDGLSDDAISGTGSGSLLSEGSTYQLYAYLTKKETKSIVGKATVGLDGTYAITNMNHGSYTLSISYQDVAVGEGLLTDLGPQLPPTWFPVGEAFGVDNAYDSATTLDTELDAQVAIETPEAGMDISDVDFGVDQPPFLTDDMVSIAAYEYIEVPVQDNDTDPQGDASMVPSSLKLVDAAGNPVEGKELVTAEGTFRITETYGISFKPFNTFHGETTYISYVIEDEAGLLSEPAVLTVEVGSPRMIISNPMLPHRSKLTE